MKLKDGWLRQARKRVCSLHPAAGLEQAGRMRSGETVLVTAAAGGTGQFVVQLAKVNFHFALHTHGRLHPCLFTC